jgi:Tfp pilus assembly pilus retraction ATPase PilT
MNARAVNRLMSFNNEAIEDERKLSRRKTSVLAEALARRNTGHKSFIETLAAAFDYPIMSLGDLRASEAAFDLLHFVEASSRGVIVVRTDDNKVRFVFSDPFDRNLIAWIDKRLNVRFETCLADRSHIAAYLAEQKENLHVVDRITHEAVILEDQTAARDISQSSPSDEHNHVAEIAAKTQSPRLDNLGFDDVAMVAIAKLLAKPDGMLLVTGPTGDAKTKTLYASIAEMNAGSDKIVTIENPLEDLLPRILQIPVDGKNDPTFAGALRTIPLPPDKIMIGEIRDHESAKIAVEAALTGHAVWAALRANNVFDLLKRFMRMGVDPYLFSTVLNGVVAQRLLRLNCEHCRVDTMPSSRLIEVYDLDPTQIAGWRLQAGRGCEHCSHTGYSGQKAVAEVVMLDDALQDMIAARASISQIEKAARRTGMRSLRCAALDMAARGETTLEEANRVVMLTNPITPKGSPV